MKVRQVLLIAISGLLAATSVGTAQPAQGSFTIGFLFGVGGTSPPPALIQALRELGYQAGRNLTIVLRSPKNNNHELPELAAELVGLKPDILVTSGTPGSLALKKATTAIPIVIAGVGSAVATDLIQSLARPGGNLTGAVNDSEEWNAKRLQMMKEMLPGIHCALYLRDPGNPAVVANDDLMNTVAAKLGIDWSVINAATPEQLDRVLAAPPDEACKAALFLPGQWIVQDSSSADRPIRTAKQSGALRAVGERCGSRRAHVVRDRYRR